MNIRSAGNLQNPLLPPSGVKRIAEPKNTVSFSNVLQSVAGVAGSIGGLALGGMNSEYASMIALQVETQRQMQLVSLVSNIEKSKHETQMAAVRNIRTN